MHISLSPHGIGIISVTVFHLHILFYWKVFRAVIHVELSSPLRTSAPWHLLRDMPKAALQLTVARVPSNDKKLSIANTWAVGIVMYCQCQVLHTVQKYMCHIFIRMVAWWVVETSVTTQLVEKHCAVRWSHCDISRWQGFLKVCVPLLTASLSCDLCCALCVHVPSLNFLSPFWLKTL